MNKGEIVPIYVRTRPSKCTKVSLSLLPISQFFTLSNVTTTRGHIAKIIKKRCQLDRRRFFFQNVFSLAKI